MKNKRRIFIFIIAMGFIVAGPVVMIIRYEVVLNQGTEYKLKLIPFDPYDAFRGRYLSLKFADDSISVRSCPKEWSYSSAVYVRLKTGNDGFAKVDSVSDNKIGNESFAASIGTLKPRDYNINRSVEINFPFESFFINEEIADKTDKIFTEALKKNSCYAIVSVYNGHALVKNVYIGNTPLVEFVKRHKEG